MDSSQSEIPVSITMNSTEVQNPRRKLDDAYQGVGKVRVRVCKQGRNDIIVKVNSESHIPTVAN